MELYIPYIEQRFSSFNKKSLVWIFDLNSKKKTFYEIKIGGHRLFLRVNISG